MSDRWNRHYLTVQEVAERLGLKPEAVMRFYREGRIPGRRMPGAVDRVLFVWSEVEAGWECRHQLSFGIEERAGVSGGADNIDAGRGAGATTAKEG